MVGRAWTGEVPPRCDVCGLPVGEDYDGTDTHECPPGFTTERSEVSKRARAIGEEHAETEAQTEALNESLDRDQRRREIAKEIAKLTYGSDDSIFEPFDSADDWTGMGVESRDGGYWVAAKVWVDAEEVEAKLTEQEDAPPESVIITFETTVDYEVFLDGSRVERHEPGELGENYGYSLHRQGECLAEYYGIPIGEEDQKHISKAEQLWEKAARLGTIIGDEIGGEMTPKVEAINNITMALERLSLEPVENVNVQEVLADLEQAKRFLTGEEVPA